MRSNDDAIKTKEEPVLLRVRDACAITNLPRSRGYELVRGGEWPSIRVGRAIRIPRQALLAWVDAKLDQ